MHNNGGGDAVGALPAGVSLAPPGRARADTRSRDASPVLPTKDSCLRVHFAYPGAPGLLTHPAFKVLPSTWVTMRRRSRVMQLLSIGRQLPMRPLCISGCHRAFDPPCLGGTPLKLVDIQT